LFQTFETKIKSNDVGFSVYLRPFSFFLLTSEELLLGVGNLGFARFSAKSPWLIGLSISVVQRETANPLNIHYTEDTEDYWIEWIRRLALHHANGQPNQPRTLQINGESNVI
jgi:hypothetical protein